jgi:hypothetical protein
MNSSVTRTELFEFWKKTEEYGVDEGPGLLLFLDLAVDELDDVRVIGVENHHLRRSARLAARLDDARKRVVPLHEGHRAARRAAAGQQLARTPDLRQVRAGARAELEEHALGPRQRQDGVHRVADRVDEARRALRRLLEAAVEPDGAVERALLVDQQVLQLVAERLQVGVGPEVLLFLRPPRNRVHHPADELADRPLTLSRPHRPAEVLRDDDVGGLLRPELGNLDVVLFEDDVALLVADDGGPKLPHDLVKRVNAGACEVARKFEAGRRFGALCLVLLPRSLTGRGLLGSPCLHRSSSARDGTPPCPWRGAPSSMKFRLSASRR